MLDKDAKADRKSAATSVKEPLREAVLSRCPQEGLSLENPCARSCRQGQRGLSPVLQFFKKYNQEVYLVMQCVLI